MTDRELNFKALFTHLPTGKNVWLYSTVDHTLKGKSGYNQLTPWLQHIGRNDEEGNEICEGDEIEWMYPRDKNNATLMYPQDKNKTTYRAVVEYGDWVIPGNLDRDYNIIGFYCVFDDGSKTDFPTVPCRVTGSIHDKSTTKTTTPPTKAEIVSKILQILPDADEKRLMRIKRGDLEYFLKNLK